MKLFLNRDRSTSPTVRSKDASVSPQNPTMKSLETATSGIVSRIRASISSYAATVYIRFIRLRIVVAAALRGDVQVSRDLGQVADRLEQVVGHVVGEIGDELDPLDAVDIVDPIQQVGEAPGSAVGVVGTDSC